MADLTEAQDDAESTLLGTISHLGLRLGHNAGNVDSETMSAEAAAVKDLAEALSLIRENRP
jgi:hypothetical protein